MATIQGKRVDTEDGVSAIVSWAAMANGDVGTAVYVGDLKDLAVQCTGGTIGTSTLQGSEDGATWGAIGAGLTIATSNQVSAVGMVPAYIRPSVGASGSGAIIVVTGKKDR